MIIHIYKFIMHTIYSTVCICVYVDIKVRTPTIMILTHKLHINCDVHVLPALPEEAWSLL